MKKTMVLVGLAALLLVPGSVLAQEEPPTYIWINYVKAKPGQGDAFAALVIEEDSKNFDPLVDSGAAITWGLAMPVVHDQNSDYTHVEWISFRGWAGADEFMNSFMKMRQSMTEEERAALMEKAEATVVEGSHADAIYRAIHVGPGSDGPRYINVGYYQAKPGKSEEAKKFYDDVAVPVYDKLLADGVITDYGLAVPDVHRGETHSHMGWFGSSDLATRDKVSAAFEAAGAARSEEENEEIGKRWMETFESDGHTDEILMVIHFYGGESEE